MEHIATSLVNIGMCISIICMVALTISATISLIRMMFNKKEV